MTFNRHTNQLIRGSQTFADPITQVQRHKRLLQSWLPKQVPILPAVVISHPSARVDIIPPDSTDREFILYPAEIAARMDEKMEASSPVFTMKEVHELSKSLLHHHRPYAPDILAKFSVQPEQIQKGIQCVNCKKFSVTKKDKKWICSLCSRRFKTAHMAALQEYVLLFGPEITNRELRAFLKIDSRSIAEKLLKKWRIKSEGTTRDFVHILRDPAE